MISTLSYKAQCNHRGLLQQILPPVRLGGQLVHRRDIDNTALFGIGPSAQSPPDNPCQRMAFAVPAELCQAVRIESYYGQSLASHVQ